MAELTTIADFADRLRVVREHRDRLVTENARIPRLEGRVAKAEQKAAEAKAALAGVEAERDEARRQLDARGREIAALHSTIQRQQRAIENAEKQSDALATLGIK